MLVLAWLITFVAGGSKTAMPHAFYLPVVVAAVRFGPRGALAVGLAAGILAGPFMPLDVATGAVQGPVNWLSRLGFLLLVGAMTALLVRRSLPSITSELAARRFRDEMAVAVEDGQLRLEFQPIIDVHAGTVAGVEALLRWTHPDRGEVSPGDFVAQAEATGCIHLITRWAIDEACNQLAQWRSTILADRTTFKLAVNVSAADLNDPQLVKHLRRTLARTGIPPKWLYLEVTETALVRDIETAIAGLTALRECGVRLAIDDFGAGESSLGKLGHLPVDTIKIDRSFLEQIERQEHGAVLFGGIIALAHAMDVTTVAEGIETLAQADIVRVSGCDLAQGFLFAKPMGGDAITAVLGKDPPRAWKPHGEDARIWWPNHLR